VVLKIETHFVYYVFYTRHFVYGTFTKITLECILK